MKKFFTIITLLSLSFCVFASFSYGAFTGINLRNIVDIEKSKESGFYGNYTSTKKYDKFANIAIPLYITADFMLDDHFGFTTNIGADLALWNADMDEDGSLKTGKTLWNFNVDLGVKLKYTPNEGDSNFIFSLAPGIHAQYGKASTLQNENSFKFGLFAQLDIAYIFDGFTAVFIGTNYNYNLTDSKESKEKTGDVSITSKSQNILIFAGIKWTLY